ncbi:hypothetical protein TDB9533_02753 [Thalassocella blandensis]|nr:hypothetical protein TDB9533_02753 [Thalassocella blandensis]
MRRTITLVTFLLLHFSNAAIAREASPPYIVNIPKPQNTDLDASYVHSEKLLELALSLSSAGNEEIIVKRNISASQSDTLKIIAAGEGIDVYWVGTSIEREKNLRPIRIPIFKGLLGFRMSLVHQDTAGQFYGITDTDQIFQFRACLGADWPDADIFEANGFEVNRSHEYRGLLNDIMQKRCDFLPLSVSEINAEYKDNKSVFSSLRLYNRFIFYYPLPMYYFVNKENTALAERIEQGLEKAIDNGEFDRYMRESPVTRHLFPIDNWIHMQYIALKNPLLPEDTDTSNPRYWIQLPQTHAKL